MSTGWYNTNRNRAYPFLRGTVNLPEDGPVTLRNLANDIIVDAGFLTSARSGFSAAEHSIYLQTIRRSGNYFYFDFVSDAPALYEAVLTFTRHVDDPDYSIEYTDSGNLGISATSLSGSSASIIHKMCDEPLLSGFLVTGKMASLALLLASNGTISRGASACVVEPALIQNLANSFVSQLALANDDRTRVSAPDDCAAVVFPFEPDELYVYDACLIGDVVFKSGYNAVVRQRQNTIIFSAAVGLGAGEPCEQIKLFAGERPPAGSDLLEGGPRCNEVLRSINGVGGRLFRFTAGTGVAITPVPEENKLLIDVDLSGLAMRNYVSAVSEEC